MTAHKKFSPLLDKKEQNKLEEPIIEASESPTETADAKPIEAEPQSDKQDLVESKPAEDSAAAEQAQSDPTLTNQHLEGPIQPEALQQLDKDGSGHQENIVSEYASVPDQGALEPAPAPELELSPVVQLTSEANSSELQVPTDPTPDQEKPANPNAEPNQGAEKSAESSPDNVPVEKPASADQEKDAESKKEAGKAKRKSILAPKLSKKKDLEDPKLDGPKKEVQVEEKRDQPVLLNDQLDKPEDLKSDQATPESPKVEQEQIEPVVEPELAIQNETEVDKIQVDDLEAHQVDKQEVTGSAIAGTAGGQNNEMKPGENKDQDSTIGAVQADVAAPEEVAKGPDVNKDQDATSGAVQADVAAPEDVAKGPDVNKDRDATIGAVQADVAAPEEVAKGPDVNKDQDATIGAVQADVVAPEQVAKGPEPEPAAAAKTVEALADAAPEAKSEARSKLIEKVIALIVAATFLIIYAHDLTTLIGL